MDPSPQEMQRTMEETSQRVLHEINEKFVRKLQANSYECAYKCYSEPFRSTQADDNCARRCMEPTERAISIVEYSINEYHQSLADCIKACNSAGNLDSNPNEVREREFFSCSAKCVKGFVSRSGAATKKCLDLLQKSQKG